MARLFIEASVSGWFSPNLARSLQRLLLERNGAVELPGIQVGNGEVVHGNKRIGMVLAQLGASHLEQLLFNRNGAVVPPRVLVEQGEVAHGNKRIGMVLAQFDPRCL